MFPPPRKMVRVCGYLNPLLEPETVKIIGMVEHGLRQVELYENAQRSNPRQIINLAEKNVQLELCQNNIKADIEFEVPLSKMSLEKYAGKDCVDMRIKINHQSRLNIIIEFDACRADQIAKKFVSRVAVLRREDLVYISFGYPGTDRMSLPEVIKYLNFMKKLAADLHLCGFVGVAAQPA